MQYGQIVYPETPRNQLQKIFLKKKQNRGMSLVN